MQAYLRYLWFSLALFGFCLGIGAGACDDDDDAAGTGSDADPDQDAGDGAAIDGASLSHAADIQPIWNSRCVPCHVGDNQGGLTLDEGYAALVNAPATEAPLDLVEPGDPEASYLWHKLNNTQAAVGGSGSKMPLGVGLLDRERAVVEAWIAAGAKP